MTLYAVQGYDQSLKRVRQDGTKPMIDVYDIPLNTWLSVAREGLSRGVEPNEGLERLRHSEPIATGYRPARLAMSPPYIMFFFA